MKIALLSIGDEILSGDTLNTNSQWIGQQLTDVGCSIIQQNTVRDEQVSIISALSQFCVLSPNYIIITGGLGPTEDDITRQILFDFVGTDSTFDEEYWHELSVRFERYGKSIPESNRSQALVPIKGEIIPNEIGSARGYKFNYEETIIISLPGVPSEMKKMMEKSIIPSIIETGIKPKCIRTLRTTGIPESALIEKISSATQINHGCKLGYYPSLFGVDIRISNLESDPVDSLANEIYKILNHSIYGEGKITFEKVIVKLGLEKDKTVATAESCTGGLIGHRLTDISGSSRLYKGGLVVYSNEAKINLLGVPAKIINVHGAVSSETAEILAVNVKNKFNTDYGISVTGIAGPTGRSIEKPVGLVYIGLATQKGVNVKKFLFGNHQKRNKLRTSQAALNWLRLSLLND